MNKWKKELLDILHQKEWTYRGPVEVDAVIDDDEALAEMDRLRDAMGRGQRIDTHAEGQKPQGLEVRNICSVLEK